MEAEKIIQFLVEKKGYKQKDIADALGVSTAQVSKWKRGEYVASEKFDKLEALAEIIPFTSVKWSQAVKTQENTNKWIAFVHFLKESAEDECALHVDLDDEQCLGLLMQIVDAGFTLPEQPPRFDFDLEDEASHELLHQTGEASLIRCYLEAYLQMYSWFNMFILVPHEEVSFDLADIIYSIGTSLYGWALSEITKEASENVPCDNALFDKALEESKEELLKFIHMFCQELVSLNRPIMADYFKLVNYSAKALDDECLYYVHDDSIEKYLPYGQRQLLTFLGQINMIAEQRRDKEEQ